MKITCNGEVRDIAPDISLQDFILEVGLNPEMLVAECDGKIIERPHFSSHLLVEGAVLELIHFVGGG